ncbi:MAG TPA: nitrile hydratase subunit alpha [Candidatus Baltobacteraceae bacterium]|nr:nitrile hydratase subunit alpha [Candidatus Baltobacteraceae bacterium]
MSATTHEHADRGDEFLERAFRELLIERGVLTQAEVDARVEFMYEREGAAYGQRVVARAWADPAFRARLLADGSAAARELGIEIGALKLVVVENTPQVHNLIVCTLCSCYPRMLLGMAPDWYKSVAYRSRAVREPRALLAEFGLQVDAQRTLRVHDSTADMRYLVLPMRPVGSESLDETALAALVTRDSMVGVAEVQLPA